MQEPGFDDDRPDWAGEELVATRIAEWDAKTPAEQDAIIERNMKLHEAFLNADDDHW